MTEELTSNNIKFQAVSYVLLAMLQRLNGIRPDLIADLLAGVRGDREAALVHPDNRDTVLATFDEAIRFLERADAQNRE